MARQPRLGETLLTQICRHVRRTRSFVMLGSLSTIVFYPIICLTNLVRESGQQVSLFILYIDLVKIFLMI